MIICKCCWGPDLFKKYNAGHDQRVSEHEVRHSSCGWRLVPSADADPCPPQHDVSDRCMLLAGEWSDHGRLRVTPLTHRVTTEVCPGAKIIYYNQRGKLSWTVLFLQFSLFSLWCTNWFLNPESTKFSPVVMTVVVWELRLQIRKYSQESIRSGIPKENYQCESFFSVCPLGSPSNTEMSKLSRKGKNVEVSVLHLSLLLNPVFI